MGSRGGGAIVLASSHSASSCAFDTLQSATRAFTAALADGLRQELEAGGVHVTSLCPEVDAEGPCLRIQDPAALVELARALHARASGRRRSKKPEELLSLYQRYLVLSAERPMA